MRLVNKKSLLYVLFVIGFILSVISGRYFISLSNFFHFFRNLFRYFQTGKYPDLSFTVIYSIRLPRVILGMAVGAGLSIAGMIFQQLFKNPIASPDILGVSSGASFGAALAMIFLSAIPFSTELSAFVFGLVAVAFVYALKKASRNDSILYLVLSGIIVSAFFSALLSGLKYLADPYQQLPSIVFWTMGGLYRATWGYSLFLSAVVILLGFIFQKLSYKIGILSADENLAKTMGINVTRFRSIILVLTSLLLALCVSISGVIGWIALIVPHIARLIFKNDKKLYIYTGILGALLLMVIDTVARSISTSEIPVGILTSLIGAPILGYLLIFKKTV